jgi:uncharacterized HhH-GPD family protein
MPDALPYTDIDKANRLLAEDPFALLVGLVLYQQVPIEKAFEGPQVLKDRLGGTLDAKTVAETDPEALEVIFKGPPAIHRFPANMAKRVQAVSGALDAEYGGDPTLLWADVTDAEELNRRLQELPGFGEYKARVYMAVLAANFGVTPDGYESLLPTWPNVSEIESAADREDLKLRKKQWKESQRG